MAECINEGQEGTYAAALTSLTLLPHSSVFLSPSLWACVCVRACESVCVCSDGGEDLAAERCDRPQTDKSLRPIGLQNYGPKKRIIIKIVCNFCGTFAISKPLNQKLNVICHSPK